MSSNTRCQICGDIITFEDALLEGRNVHTGECSRRFMEDERARKVRDEKNKKKKQLKEEKFRREWEMKDKWLPEDPGRDEWLAGGAMGLQSLESLLTDIDAHNKKVEEKDSRDKGTLEVIPNQFLKKKEEEARKSSDSGKRTVQRRKKSKSTEAQEDMKKKKKRKEVAVKNKEQTTRYEEEQQKKDQEYAKLKEEQERRREQERREVEEVREEMLRVADEHESYIREMDQRREELRRIAEEEERRLDERKEDLRTQREEEERVRSEELRRIALEKELKSEAVRRRVFVVAENEETRGESPPPPPPPPHYYSREECRKLREEELNYEGMKKEPKIWEKIMGDVLGSMEAKLEGDLKCLEVREEVWKLAEEARTREDAWELLELMERKAEEYKRELMGRVDLKLQALLEEGKLKLGKAPGQYKFKKTANRAFIHTYLKELRELKSSLQERRGIGMEEVGTLLKLLERLLRLHARFQG